MRRCLAPGYLILLKKNGGLFHNPALAAGRQYRPLIRSYDVGETVEFYGIRGFRRIIRDLLVPIGRELDKFKEPALDGTIIRSDSGFESAMPDVVTQEPVQYLADLD